MAKITPMVEGYWIGYPYQMHGTNLVITVNVDLNLTTYSHTSRPPLLSICTYDAQFGVL